MPDWVGTFGLNWAVAHQQYLIGVALGAVLGNPVVCATLLFGVAVKIPVFGSWLAAHPEEAKAWFDGFDKAIDKAVDKYAANNRPPALVPPTLAPPAPAGVSEVKPTV